MKNTANWLDLNQGLTPDFTTIEGLLNSIDEKLENIPNNKDILVQIFEKIKNSPNYTEHLEEIKELIKQCIHDCKCGNNNEGVLGELDKILG